MSVGVSAIVGIYGVFQLAGKIPINQGGVRLDGTLGNATYLAAFMLINFFLALFLLVRSRKWSVWAWIYGVVMALQLFIVGEKTGQIDSMLENTFLYYKRQYNDLLSKVTAVLQPILLFFSAGLICAIAVALFVPLFKLSGSVKSGGQD